MLFGRKIILAALFTLAGAGMANAHDFWMQGQDLEAGKTMRVETGFGHSFAKTSPLPEKMVGRFNPVEVVSAGGKVEMQPGEANNVLTGKNPADKGSYYVLGSMKTSVFTRSEGGFEQKFKDEVADAKMCNEYSMFAKALINVDTSGDLDFIRKPQGQKIEIIPQVSPSSVKPGQPMPLLVLFDGEPLAAAEVSAVFDGFAHGDENAAAFSSKTNKQGVVSFIPLVEGFWKVKVAHKTPYADAKKCDFSNYVGSVTFRVGK